MRFNASDCPSVCRWYAVNMRLLMRVCMQTSRQNLDVIRESLSDIMPLDVSKRHSTCRKKSSAKSAAVVSLRVGMNRAYFVSLSTTVSIASKRSPFLCLDSGNPVIQSKLISANGYSGIGRGFSLSYGLCLWTAFLWQAGHIAMYFLTSLLIPF